MIKSIEKLKVRIDQNLNRAEKSEALSEDVAKIESRISSLKQLCQTVTKKLSSEAGTSTSSGKLGNDGAAVEKRIRKTPEFALGQTFQENARAYARHIPVTSSNGNSGGGGAGGAEGGGLSQFLMDGGHLLNDLAALHVQYEITVEKLVLQALTGIVDEHVPPLAKERKTLSSLLLEYDAAKSRLVNYRSKEGSGSSGGGTVESDLREERLAADLAEIETKLNFARDSVELHMLQFLSRESEVGMTMLKYLEQRKTYHEDAANKIGQQLSHFQSLINSPSVASPVFGCGLDDHLRKQGKVCIAWPLRSCICRLLQMEAVKEEGLFRVASSTLKVKRLAALFDTGEATDTALLDITDPHVFTGALKLYLRELPIPILGSNYNRWISEFGQCNTDDKKKESIDVILATLPQNNRHNLHFLLKFLHLAASHSDFNKMSAANLAIVMAPNLLWQQSSEGEHKPDLQKASVVNDIVEKLIEHVDFFFRGFGTGNIDFFREVSLQKPKSLMRPPRPSNPERVVVTVSSTSASMEEDKSEDNITEEANPPPPEVAAPGTPTMARTTPVPRPRHSKAAKGPPPPLAPKPTDRHSIQLGQSHNSTHL